jgi:RNA polymerase sigma factor (sigma-70 family)
VELPEQLFRREAGRLLAALTRIFGVHNLALAEDVTQDAFCRALELWKVQGVPANPGAWLMTTAKRRALDMVRRQRTAQNFAPELGRLLDSEWTCVSLIDEAFAPATIRDAQLRMMFSCCHPRLPEEAQLALILNLLCGFGAAEIAALLLERRAAIEKRITRGKHALRAAQQLFELHGQAFSLRLPVVQRALYVLFSAGYHGAHAERAVRSELCAEALDLSGMLLRHTPAATPVSFALHALMCLHAARLPARVDDAGELSPLVEQDRTRWDPQLLALGLHWFERSAAGETLSAYHVEAAIAVAHTAAAHPRDTNWPQIVLLYDRLMAIAPSPVVALNRAIALGEAQGPAAGLTALQALAGHPRLTQYPFYPAALAEYYQRGGASSAAREQLQQALHLARNDAERRFLTQRLQSLVEG